MEPMANSLHLERASRTAHPPLQVGSLFGGSRPLGCSLAIALLAACSHPGRAAAGTGLLAKVADVPLPGRSTRFDYQEIDARAGLLVIAHMHGDSVLLLDLADGSVRKELTGIPTPRGVTVDPGAGIIFVTSTPGFAAGTPGHLVLIDDAKLSEIARVETGSAPDGNAWDADDRIVGVSDQRDGALSIIADAGRGARKQVRLGDETGNVVYDHGRHRFWITVVGPKQPDRLVQVDPKTATVTATIALPGCRGAHGLRIHPDGKSALIACEDNERLARVDLGNEHAIVTARTGAGPDVLAIDPGLGWLYVAAESGDVTVFDLGKSGLVLVGHVHPGAHAHTVSVDPATHRVFFPLMKGPKGRPILRIMRPVDQ